GRSGRSAVIVVVILKRGTVGPQSRHVVGAAGAIILGLLPVQAHEPVEASARFGREPQLIGPALRVGVVFVVLNRHVAAGVRPGSVNRVVQAGDTLVGTFLVVLYVLRVLVLLARGQRPVSAREDQIPDADVAIHVKIERLG